MLNSYRLLRNSESTLSLHNCFPSHQPSPNKNNKIEFISPINGNQFIPKNILYTPQTNKTSTEETMDLIKRCLDEKN